MRGSQTRSSMLEIRLGRVVAPADQKRRRRVQAADHEQPRQTRCRHGRCSELSSHRAPSGRLGAHSATAANNASTTTRSAGTAASARVPERSASTTASDRSHLTSRGVTGCVTHTRPTCCCGSATPSAPRSAPASPAPSPVAAAWPTRRGRPTVPVPGPAASPGTMPWVIERDNRSHVIARSKLHRRWFDHGQVDPNPARVTSSDTVHNRAPPRQTAARPRGHRPHGRAGPPPRTRQRDHRGLFEEQQPTEIDQHAGDA